MGAVPQSTHFNDSEFGSGYTVKRYHSTKRFDVQGWRHVLITLHPESEDPKYEIIELPDDESVDFKVIGLFEQVIEL